MDSIQAAIVECCASAQDDADLIQKIEQVILANDDAVYPVIFSTLTSLELSEKEAKRYWGDVLVHRKSLIASLGREVCLVPAMGDFLCSEIKLLKNPKIIDSKAFE